MNEIAEFVCPYCAQPSTVAVDPTGGGDQRFVVDCEVCCRPIVFDAHIGPDGSVTVTATPEHL